jgi:hypothetical protein
MRGSACGAFAINPPTSDRLCPAERFGGAPVRPRLRLDITEVREEVDPLEATLEPRLVVSDTLSGEFFIPDYQRGYRWGEVEVIRLLDDIRASAIDPEVPGDYYLQPIVVMRRNDDTWELIDGQQRLTTLYLILKHIRIALPSAAVNYSLTYETRQNSRAYLETLEPERRNENIDFHHIFGAYDAISRWFAAQPNPLQSAVDMYTALSKRVYVIWYEAQAGIDPRDLFTRLNVGRIPLTDAELVKASVLSESAGVGATTDRQDQVAAQWDRFERDLRDRELWSFVTGSSRERPTHIDLLFEILAGEPIGRGRPRFWTFEKLRPEIESSVRDFWDRVVSIHGLLTGWFDDRELYHRIGYLVATGDSFADIVQLAGGLSKAAVRFAIVERIQNRLRRSRAGIADLTYERDLTTCRNVLLLMNIETVLSHDEAQHFSFHAFASGDWSVEHIHAQNAESLNRADQWSTWLELHARAVSSLPSLPDAAKVDLIARIGEALARIDAEKFRMLEREILEIFADYGDDEVGEDLHRLPNLALLSRGINSALSNSVFEVKRQEILKRDKAGSYIPPCTRNVFLKYYTDSADQQLHIWGPQDRDAYSTAMLQSIERYLTPESEAIAL